MTVAATRALLLICTIFQVPAGAQKVLDLGEALRTAEVSNLELRAARQQRAVALAGMMTARQFPNPTVAFSIARDTPHEGVTWDQPLELGGKRSKRVAVAQAEQALTDTEIGILSRQIRRRTREAFFRAVAARSEAEQAQTALDLSTRVKEAVQQRFDAGDVAELEVIQADVEVARSSADYEAAVQTLRSADVALAALLNQRFDAPVMLSGALMPVPQAPELTQVTATALRSSADILRTAQELRIEEKRLTLAKAQRVPDVTVQVGADLNSPPDFRAGLKGQIGVTVPLFYHGQGEIALATARTELLRLTLQAQQTNVSAQVTAAYFDHVAKTNLARQYEQRILPQTVRLEKMAEESYRAGKSPLLIWIDAQRRLNDVRRAYLESLLATQTSFAMLEEAEGVPLD